MSTPSKTTYFIIGSSRGIGFNLVKILSASTNNVVIATIRGSSSLPKNKQLEDLGNIRENIHIVHLDVTKNESIENIANEIKKKLHLFKELTFLSQTQEYLIHITRS